MKKLHRYYHTFRALYRAQFLKKKTPLIISWCITDQSNCGSPCYSFPPRTEQELSQAEVIDLIDQMGNAGVQRVILMGGDPMFRFDFGSIVDQLHEKNISMVVDTHGFYVERKIEILKKVDRVLLPLDGPEPVQDELRYRGSYQEVLRAARLLNDHTIPLAFICTLTAKNIDMIEVPLEVSSHFNAGVYYQPIQPIVPGTKTAHPLMFSSDRMKQAMLKLMRLKKSQYPNIANSEKSLHHLYHYPDSSLVHCESRTFAAHIDLNGDVLHCPFNRPEIVLHVLKDGFAKAFQSLPPISCGDCWQVHRLHLHDLTGFSFRNVCALLK